MLSLFLHYEESFMHFVLDPNRVGVVSALNTNDNSLLISNCTTFARFRDVFY